MILLEWRYDDGQHRVQEVNDREDGIQRVLALRKELGGLPFFWSIKDVVVLAEGEVNGNELSIYMKEL